MTIMQHIGRLLPCQKELEDRVSELDWQLQLEY